MNSWIAAPILFAFAAGILFLLYFAIGKIFGGNVRGRKGYKELPSVSAQLPKPESMDEIIPGLFLGDRYAIYETKKCGIENILNVTREPDSTYMSMPQGANWKEIPVEDNTKTDIAKYFPETYAFIDQALKQGKVLVHCEQGISRSPTVVAAYLMKKWVMSADEALKFIASKRPSINPNPSFINQLKNYQSYLAMKSRSMRSS